jgi:hypothetical protein
MMKHTEQTGADMKFALRAGVAIDISVAAQFPADGDG